MIIEGKNAVLEVLRSDTTVDCIMVAKECDSDITRLAKSRGVKLQYVDKSTLDKNSLEGRHQGYIATVADYSYYELEDIISDNSSSIIVVLDQLNDPHNLGSIIRVCECAGVDGIVIGKNRQVAVTDTVVRCSAGAVAHTKVARVTNINHAIQQLQSSGYWAYCADMEGGDLYRTSLTGKIVLVVGGEGHGVSQLTRKICDGVVSIPMSGSVNSLNASVACGIVVYEAVRQREGK